MKRYTQPYQAEEDKQSAPGSIMSWRFWRLADHTVQPVDGGVVVEEPLEIRLNNQPVAVLMRSPGLEKELAAGFCLGEGLVADLMDIALVRHCGRAGPSEVAEGDALDISRNRVDLTLTPGVPAVSQPGDAVRLIRSGCGRTEVGALAEDLMPIDAQLTISMETLRHLPGQITRRQTAYRAAGGVHAAAVFDAQGRAIVVCEDIGRHNALDKAAGYCLLRGISLRDKVMVSTGRASYDMVAKGVRLGVPIIASISSPTSLAVELAELLNCTLLGYLRGNSLNVYTHRWRVVGSPEPRWE
ncbi:MAG: formate dehydrogenase accessory sulfurtransferase FdhD [Anaerolineae bacterium]